MFIPESVADSCVILYMVLKVSSIPTSQSKVRIILCILIQHSKILVVFNALVVSVHCGEELACTFSQFLLNFRCCRIDN